MYLTELHYLPGINVLIQGIRQGGLLLEAHENYQKQSYRNRCIILTSQGPRELVIPVQHLESKMITEVRIDTSQPWAVTHWRSLKSAYGNSPFYEFYAPELQPIYQSPPPGLFNLNLTLLRICLKLIRLQLPIELTQEYQVKAPEHCPDGRDTIHPKRQTDNMEVERYVQVFGSNFAPGLSILDLIFNLGPDASAYLFRATRLLTQPVTKGAV